jgi:hypothetical protein
MLHYPRLFSDNARVALPLSEPSAEAGMPVLHFLTILYEDDHIYYSG